MAEGTSCRPLFVVTVLTHSVATQEEVTGILGILSCRSCRLVNGFSALNLLQLVFHGVEDFVCSDRNLGHFLKDEILYFVVKHSVVLFMAPLPVSAGAWLILKVVKDILGEGG